MASRGGHVSGGRFTLNVVTGWYRLEIEMFGAPLLDHDVRYDMAADWIEIIRRMWTSGEEFDFEGKFYKVKGAIMAPKPIQKPIPRSCAPALPLIGTKDQIVEDLSFLEHCGFDGIVLTWPRYIDDMRRFKTETFPLLAQAGLR